MQRDLDHDRRVHACDPGGRGRHSEADAANAGERCGSGAAERLVPAMRERESWTWLEGSEGSTGNPEVDFDASERDGDDRGTLSALREKNVC
jgi:hypothetical protein